jgi:hypothetical protein
MNSHRRGRIVSPRHNSRRRFQKAVVEVLEERRLLTALYGGDIFTYQQAPGTTVTVTISGNVSAEFVGGVVDDQNNLILSDLPGAWSSSSTASGRANLQQLGGVGGANGEQVVGIRDNVVEVPQLPQGSISAASAQINFQALAASSSGATYGINVAPSVSGGAPLPNRTLVQLAKFDNTTSTATVQAMFQAPTKTCRPRYPLRPRQRRRTSFWRSRR